MKKQLLIGCGHSRVKRMWVGENTGWDELVTLDINPECNPDVVHDLEVLPYPFENNSFDEIHAYGVLEHLSDQGDYKSFFAQFEEFYRILKPNGFLVACVPSERGQIVTTGRDSKTGEIIKSVIFSPQQWGDPSHRRVINLISLTFLSQESYKQCGHTMMTDFRNIYKGDFTLAWHQDTGELLNFVLQPIKEVPGWTLPNTPKK
jgi:SAM-dependent methyltransferase